MSKNLPKIIFSAIGLILPIFTVSFVSADNVDYSVIVEPVLNITTSGDTEGVVSLDLNPETKAFDSKNLTVTVGTNNETGYKLYVNTTGNTTNLVEKNDSNLYIQTLADNGTTGYTENTFTANRWGYKLNTQNYFPFVSGTLVNSSNTATAGVSSTLTFGAKANYDTKAGSYALALNFQATANPHYKTIEDAEYMQEVSSKADGGCPSTLTTGTAYTIKDSRDEKTYHVARLADGNCWLLDNLRLSTTSVGLTSDNSNVAYTSSNAWYLPSSSSSGFSSYDTKMINTSYIETTTTSYGSGYGYIGVYYNYCAATAGTYCYASGSGTGDAEYDICPKGWRMPTGGSSGEYQALYTAYSSNAANFRNALSTPLSGCFYSSSADYQGSNGYFWSSTRYNGNNMYSLYVNSSSVNPANYYDRSNGFSVRCILK